MQLFRSVVKLPTSLIGRSKYSLNVNKALTALFLWCLVGILVLNKMVRSNVHRDEKTKPTFFTNRWKPRQADHHNLTFRAVFK